MTKTNGETPPALKLHVSELRRFSAGCLLLADELRNQSVLPGDDGTKQSSGARISMAQVAFFLTAAVQDLAGHEATRSAILEKLGPAVAKSLSSTYAVFLEADNRDPTRLGWLTQVVNDANRKEKFLKLTDKGRELMKTLYATLELDD